MQTAGLAAVVKKKCIKMVIKHCDYYIKLSVFPIFQHAPATHLCLSLPAFEVVFQYLLVSLQGHVLLRHHRQRVMQRADVRLELRDLGEGDERWRRDAVGTDEQHSERRKDLFRTTKTNSIKKKSPPRRGTKPATCKESYFGLSLLQLLLQLFSVHFQHPVGFLKSTDSFYLLQLLLLLGQSLGRSLNTGAVARRQIKTEQFSWSGDHGISLSFCFVADDVVLLVAFPAGTFSIYRDGLQSGVKRLG